MKYDFENDSLTPVSLEKSLGLKRGDIKETAFDGVVIVVDDSVASDVLKANILTELNKRGLPKGRKPKAV